MVLYLPLFIQNKNKNTQIKVPLLTSVYSDETYFIPNQLTRLLREDHIWGMLGAEIF